MSEQAIPARPTATVPPAETRPPKVRTRPTSSMFEPTIMRHAVGQAFVKLDPRKMVHVPVMFVVEIGSVVTTIEFFSRPDVFVGLVTLWLWATVLFANFAEAVAEGRGKAQADTLRRSRTGDLRLPAPARRHHAADPVHRAAGGQPGRGDRRPGHSRRRRRGGGDGRGRRVGHYRRVGPGDPRVGRGP